MKHILKAGALFLLSLLAVGGAFAQTPPSQCITSAVAGGTSDAITLPLIPCWPASTLLILTATLSNTTTTPTLSINGGVNYTIQTYSRQALGVGYFVPGGTYLLVFNGSNWQLLNPPYIPPSSSVAGPSSSTIGDAACWANTNGSLLSDCGLLGTIARQNANSVAITGGTIASTTLSNDILSGTNINSGTISGGAIQSANITGSIFSGGSLQGTITNSGTVSGGTYTGPNLNAALIQASTINTSTLNSPTINTPSIANPAITGGTALSFQLESSPRSQTLSGSYTVQPSDCGAHIALGGGIYTVTFPNNTLVPDECIVYLYNYSSNGKIVAGNIITGFPTSGVYWIFPGQTVSFNWDNSAWVSDGPRRYVVSGQQIYVAPSNCSDGNDGLLSSTPICDISTAVQYLQNNFECKAGSVIQINMAGGTYAGVNWSMHGPPPPGCGDQIAVVGNTTSPSNVLVTCATGTDCFDVEDGMIMTLNGIEIGCQSATGVFARQQAVVDLNVIEFGSCNGGTDILASEGGHINILNPGGGSFGALIAGNVATAIEASGTGSVISATSSGTPSTETLSVTSNPITVTAFAEAIQGGNIYLGPSQITGGGSVTGTMWAADSLSLIYTDGSGIGCNSFFNNVGTVNGSATNGAVCN